MIEDTTEVNQNVTGDHNIFTGTGDINYHYQQVSETSFYEPDLSKYAPPKFVTPQVTDELRKRLYEQHMVLLGGSVEVEKADLARHLAWYLRKLLVSDEGFSQTKIKVYERELGLDKPLTKADIEKLKNQVEVTIFILSKVTHQNTNYDLNKFNQIFLEAPEGQKYYAILITDNPHEAWKLNPNTEAHFWEELTLERVYSLKNLCDILSQKLKAFEDRLPKELRKRYYISTEGILWKHEIHKNLASELKSPARIDFFVQLLIKRVSKTDLEEVKVFINKLNELLRITAGDRNQDKVFLKSNFSSLSSPDEKLFALGLSLFYGLFELQFFEALNQVVRNAWHRELHDTGILDYYHLDQLQIFFKFVPMMNDECLVGNLFSDQRRLMLELAWESHRMHIAAILPTLVNMIKVSILPWISISHHELYRDLFRRTLLRSVIVDIISQIGEISVQTVEGALLDLAMDPREGPKNVAALALAEWYRHGKRKQLFELLLRLQKNDSEILRIVKEYDIPVTNISKNNSNLQLMIAKSVNYCAQYNTDPLLPPEMYKLLENLTTHEDSRVRQYFVDSILKNVFPPYLVQLKGILEIATQDKLIRNPIVEMLAETYENGSQSKQEDITEILSEWSGKIKEYKNLIPDETLSENGNVGDKNSNENSNGDSDDEKTYSWELLQLTQVLSYDRIGMFSAVRDTLPEFLTEAAIIYKADLVDMVVDIYLNQRKKQNSRTTFITVNDQQYPIWVNDNRPLTDIEIEILRWITEEYDHTIIYEIVLLASIEFVCKLETFEKDYVPTKEVDNDEVKFETDCESIKDINPLEATLPASFLTFIFAGLMSLFLVQSLDKSRTFMSFAFAANAVNAKYVGFVLDKWTKYPDNNVKLMGYFLKSFLWVVKHIWILVGGIVLSALMIITLSILMQ